MLTGGRGGEGRRGRGAQTLHQVSNGYPPATEICAAGAAGAGAAQAASEHAGGRSQLTGAPASGASNAGRGAAHEGAAAGRVTQRRRKERW